MGAVPAPARPHRQWWRDAVIYQVYPRSFADSDGDGIGDLHGVLERLGALVELGVDAVWLSPFYPSPQIDAGYDVEDHRGVDPLLGGDDAYARLSTAVHDRGWRLLGDLTTNHTGDTHEWFVGASSDPDSPTRGWYY